MDPKDTKWIEDAFKKATQIDGKSVTDFSDFITEAFKKDFPHTMASFTMAYGNEKAAKMAVLMLSDKDIITLCRCFFVSGYVYRKDEVEGKRSDKKDSDEKEGEA